MKQILLTKQAEKSFKLLPKKNQEKTRKQFELLLTNYRHPSLRARKMSGVNHFEARINIHYRFTFSLVKEGILVLTIGLHDEGLGKK